MKSIILGLGLLSAGTAVAQDRPNIVWFLTEDATTDYLKIFRTDGLGASTPNVAFLAENGVKFYNAYSNAPVSSAARSTLFTCCYAPRLGVDYHRKLQPMNLPDGIESFPAYLRQAGYYTTNSVKTDYNFVCPEDTWDNIKAPMFGWRDRPTPQTPFFHVISCMKSHESQLHFPVSDFTKVKNRYHNEDVPLAIYHPDTYEFRYTYSRFFDRIDDADADLGLVIKELTADKLMDNTIIFYFGDNGGSLPGSKGYTSEWGLKVPLVIYVPEKWRAAFGVEKGSSVNGFVSFIDLGPTALKLAGIEPPKGVDGKAFMGKGVIFKDVEKRSEVVGYSDRFDELYAFTRTLRIGDFKYVRNFQSYNPEGLYNEYRYMMYAFRQWKSLFVDGKLNDVQGRFFSAPMDPEELIDLDKDPFEIINLAKDPRYAAQLETMRNKMYDFMVSLPDASFYPECVMIERAAKYDNVVTRLTEAHRADIKRYAEVSRLATQPFEKVKSKIAASLASKDEVETYWALMDCCSFASKAESFKESARKLLGHDRGYIQGKATLFLAQLGERDVQDRLNKALAASRDDAEALMILNDAVYLRDVLNCKFELDKNIVKGYRDELKRRLDYLRK